MFWFWQCEIIFIHHYRLWKYSWDLENWCFILNVPKTVIHSQLFGKKVPAHPMCDYYVCLQNRLHWQKKNVWVETSCKNLWNPYLKMLLNLKPTDEISNAIWGKMMLCFRKTYLPRALMYFIINEKLIIIISCQFECE